MSGTKQGGLQARETNKLRHGQDYYKRIGKLGGEAGNTGGFWHAKHVLGNHNAAIEAGRKGGAISRRPKKVVVDGV